MPLPFAALLGPLMSGMAGGGRLAAGSAMQSTMGAGGAAARGGTLGNIGKLDIPESKKTLKWQKTKTKSDEESNKQQKKGIMSKTMGLMGINMSASSMLKQSQLFTGFLGAFFQIIGAFVDVLLAPMMPFLFKVLGWFTKLLPVWSFLAKTFWWTIKAIFIVKFLGPILVILGIFLLVWGAIKYVWPWMKDFWDNTLKKVFTKEFWVGMKDGIVDWWNDKVQPEIDVAIESFLLLVGLVTSVWDMAYEFFFVKIGSPIAEYVRNAWGWIQGCGIGRFFGSIVDTGMSLIKGFFTFDWLKDLFWKAMGWVESAYRTVGNLIKGAPLLGGAGKGMVDFADQLGRAIDARRVKKEQDKWGPLGDPRNLTPAQLMAAGERKKHISAEPAIPPINVHIDGTKIGLTEDHNPYVSSDAMDHARMRHQRLVFNMERNQLARVNPDVGNGDPYIES